MTGIDRRVALAAENVAAEYQQITQLTSRMGILADERDWQRLGELFDHTVELDNTSLRGGKPASLSRAEVVASWRQGLEGLDATQHLIANHQVNVEGDQATCVAYFQAVHQLGGPDDDPLFTVGGRYDFQLRREGPHAPWHIHGLVATAQWTSGNRNIMRLAADKTRDRQPPS